MLSVSINIANLLSSIIKSAPLLALSHHSAPVHISNHDLMQWHITDSPIRFPWQRANHNARNTICNNTYKNVCIIVNGLTAFRLEFLQTPYMEAITSPKPKFLMPLTIYTIYIIFPHLLSSANIL